MSRATPSRPAPVSEPTRAAAIEDLAAAVRQIEGLHRRTWGETVSTGSPALDRLLPHRALRRGTLVEWLAEGAGNGAATLALIAGREACRQGGALVVIDRRRCFYPPAAAGLQIDLEQLIIVRPQRQQEEIWALDQALRSSGVAAVLCWPDTWSETALRRLQLAAEGSGALALMVRGNAARAAPSWAELRLGVEPLPVRSPSTGRQSPSSLLKKGTGSERTVDLSNEVVVPRGACPPFQQAPSAGQLKKRTGSERTVDLSNELVIPRGACPLFQQDTSAGRRRWRVELLRLRGSSRGGVLELQLDERTGLLHESRQANPLRLAAAVAVGAPGRRSTGA